MQEIAGHLHGKRIHVKDDPPTQSAAAKAPVIAARTATESRYVSSFNSDRPLEEP